MRIAPTKTGTLVRLAGAGLILKQLTRYFRSKQTLDVSGCYVLVTGCDSGFGLGVVERLIAQNALVIAFTYTEAGAERAVATGAVAAHAFDITDSERLGEAVAETLALCRGKLWGVVHNAGVVLPGFIEYQSLENFRRVMDVNFFAVTDLTQRLIPALKGAAGRVVLVSSVDGIVSLPGNAPYDASKFAIEAYADALRTELSFWDVAVSVVNPSTMRTPLAMGFFEGYRQVWNSAESQTQNAEWKKAYPEEWLDEYVTENQKRLEQIAQDPKHAINDIMHALTAKHPELRYLSGTAAKTIFYALWKMPERWSFAVKKSLINPLPRL